MFTRAMAALLVLGALASRPAVARTEPLLQEPAFGIALVGRTTPAINYRPRRGETTVDLVGTALMPDARGKAKVEGKRGYMEIDVRVDELGPASQFGAEYLTYVLWAVTPEGRAENLGEIQIDDDDDTLDVTTQLQTFGLIVTAEPYFAVTQPSDVVVLENVVREDTEGRVEAIQARYRAVQRGSYLMRQDPSRLDVKRLEPGESLDLAEARNAVMLARLAGADRYAADAFAKAQRLLEEAENAREKRRRGNAVMMPARQAVQTAEDARLIAIQKQEEASEAEQRALAARREAAALDRARAEEAARRQVELDKAAEEARRRQAETEADRLRLDAERERLRTEQEKEALKQQAEAEKEALRKQAELEREALTERTEAERLAEANARLAAEREKAQADAARAAAEAEAAQTRATAERERAALREELREKLNVILETRETARGLVVNMSDVLFDTDSAGLTPGAREKLAKIAGVLLSHKGLQISVEGHADSQGGSSYNQRLSERRADSVRDYLVREGIEPGAVATSGAGESEPLVSNRTAAGRQQNRRVEIVVSGEAIGTTTIRRQQ